MTIFCFINIHNHDNKLLIHSSLNICKSNFHPNSIQKWMCPLSYFQQYVQLYGTRPHSGMPARRPTNWPNHSTRPFSSHYTLFPVSHFWCCQLPPVSTLTIPCVLALLAAAFVGVWDRTCGGSGQPPGILIDERFPFKIISFDWQLWEALKKLVPDTCRGRTCGRGRAVVRGTWHIGMQKSNVVAVVRRPLTHTGHPCGIYVGVGHPFKISLVLHH